MIRFAAPEYLQLLWVIPVLLILIFTDYRWRLSAINSWASASLRHSSLPTLATANVTVKRTLSVVALAAVIVALSGPQVGTKIVEVTREGSDIAIAIDLSYSMLTEDIAPNRFEKARHEIVRLLGKLRGDRIALVPFAGAAFVQVPMTLDYSAVNSILSILEPGIIPVPGTSLANAVKQARRSYSNDNKAQKVLIIITDGEDLEEGISEEIDLARKEGIVIYTIGMASPTGGPIPEKNRRGRVSSYRKDDKGGTIISRLNEPLLKEIAAKTDGEFYQATTTGDEFRQLFDKLSGLDKDIFEAKEYSDYEDRFQWFVAFALILLIAEQMIPQGRKRSKE